MWKGRILGFGFALLLFSLPAVQTRPSQAASQGGESKGPWTIPVLVLRYFPVTADKEKIDIAVTSDVGASLKEVQAKCDRMTREAIEALQEGTDSELTRILRRQRA